MIFNPSQPGFHILICLIQIWTPKDPNNPLEEPESPLLISEVEQIEIEDSYKKLIGTASVKFPRGTVIKKTFDEISGKAYESQITADMTDCGVLRTVRTDSEIAIVSHFKVEQRIKIMIGYTDDPKIAAMCKVNTDKKSIFNDRDMLTKYKEKLATMFDGYITKCSIDAPIEIRCENLASRLKKISCPATRETKNMTVNDFLADDGKYKLLQGSGLMLHPDTYKCKIDIGQVNLPSDLTVADVLTTWGRQKLFAFVKYDGVTPCIAVGRSYFSNAGDDSIIKLKEEEADTKKRNILFDYHVAENGLTLMSTDKDFLAVEATSLGKDDKFYHITVRKNPDYDANNQDSKPYQVLNETRLSKKAMKLGATILGSSKDRVDLSLYTVIPYMSRKIGISKEDLLDEAIKYFESYNMNGMEGSLTIFGDLALRSGEKVHLSDKCYQQKNGWYLVDEVHTKFGTGGYRQTIKLPYRIASDKQEEPEAKNE